MSTRPPIPAAERGAPGRIATADVLAAVGLVSYGRVVDLSMPLGPATPSPPHRHGLVRYMNRDGGDYAAGARTPGGFQFAEDTVLMPTHIGTHVDALAHVWHNDTLYDGSGQDAVRSTTGATRCGADKLAPVLARGILLDAAPASSLPNSHAIDAAALEAAAARAGVEVQRNDVVLVRTGWLGRTGDDARTYFEDEPGIDLSAAEWLAEREVAMVGADNFAVEPLPFAPGEAFPVHQFLITDHGVPLLEGVALDELATLADGPFLFVVLPLGLVGSTASPVTPVAVL